jgi:YfiH family protein
MKIIRPSIFPKGVIAGVSTRQGGVGPDLKGLNMSFNVGDNPDYVKRNRTMFLEELGISTSHLALPRQIHGSRVRHVEGGGEYPETDGLITRSRGTALGVSIADCVPVLVFDPVRHAAGAAHSGWRGTAAGVVREMLGMMVSSFESSVSDLFAYIGPSASACCYVVGGEVARLFPEEFARESDGEYLLDLKGVIRKQLTTAGVQQERIETSPHCTIMESTLFHSYRRDRERSGRMLAVIALTA